MNSKKTSSSQGYFSDRMIKILEKGESTSTGSKAKKTPAKKTPKKSK